VDSQQLAMSQQEGMAVPAGAPHQLKNDGNGEVVFLVISEPPSHGDRVVEELA